MTYLGEPAQFKYEWDQVWRKQEMKRLTRKRLEAIAESLGARLAGEINAEFESNYLDRAAYEAALDWADEQIKRRAIAKAEGTS